MRDMKKKHVLIVDDEPMLREILAQHFSLSGYSVQEASSADEAMQILVDHQFDALVTDVSMPGGTGYDLIGLVRFVDGKIPVILMSGKDPEEVMSEESYGSGVYKCLAKPIGAKDLLAVVEEAIGQYQGEGFEEELLAG